MVGWPFYAILLHMRKLRNFSTDRCYHLVSRVANKAFYFTEEERGRFVERMWRIAYFACIEVVAYCVMSNHFHILVYVPHLRGSPHQWGRTLGFNNKLVQEALAEICHCDISWFCGNFAGRSFCVVRSSLVRLALRERMSTICVSGQNA